MNAILIIRTGIPVKDPVKETLLIRIFSMKIRFWVFQGLDRLALNLISFIDFPAIDIFSSDLFLNTRNL